MRIVDIALFIISKMIVMKSYAMIGIIRLVRNRIFIGSLLFTSTILFITLRVKIEQCETKQLMTNTKYEQMKLSGDYQKRIAETSIQMQETLAKFASLQQNYKLLKDEFADFKEECSSISSKQSQKIIDLYNEKNSTKKSYERINNSKNIVRSSKGINYNQFNAQIGENENFYKLIFVKTLKTVTFPNVIPRGVVPFDDSKFQDAEAMKEMPIPYKNYGSDVKQVEEGYSNQAGEFHKTVIETLKRYKLKNEINDDQGKAYPEEMNFNMEDELAEDGKLFQIKRFYFYFIILHFFRR